jgi:hypothetical protein
MKLILIAAGLMTFVVLLSAFNMLLDRVEFAGQNNSPSWTVWWSEEDQSWAVSMTQGHGTVTTKGYCRWEAIARAILSAYWRDGIAFTSNDLSGERWFKYVYDFRKLDPTPRVGGIE